MAPRTQEQRRAETRAQLLAAAADLFAHKGFHAASAEAVASAADRTTGALYDHFGGKEGLLVALLEQWVAQTIVDLTAVFDGAATLDDRVGALWDGVIRHDSESGDAWLLLEFELWLHAARDPELGVVGAERFAVMRDGLAGGLRDWSAEYAFTLPSPPEQVAAQVIALLIGAAFQHRLDPAAMGQTTVREGVKALLGVADPPSCAGTRTGRPPVSTAACEATS